MVETTVTSASSARDSAAKARAQVRNYFASLPVAARRRLQALRKAIGTAAPGAVECISYGIPAFRLDGRVLVWYAAWKEHCSLYPMTPAVRRAHAAELKRYEMSRGTVRFPMTRPLPLTLVRRLVKTRITELRKAGRP